MSSKESKSQQNSDDSDQGNMYERDIREALLLKEIIKDLSIKKSISSLIDVGVGESGASLLLALSNKDIKIVVGVDKDPPIPPWVETQLWQKLGNEKSFSFVEGNIFDEERIRSQLEEDIEKFDLCFIHQTLHHLRANDCKFYSKDNKCKIEQDRFCELQHCDNAIGNFYSNQVFNILLSYSDVVVISEDYYIGKDNDKKSSQAGLLNIREIEDMIKEVINNHHIIFYRPCKKELTNNTEELISKLRFADHMAFVVIKK